MDQKFEHSYALTARYSGDYWNSHVRNLVYCLVYQCVDIIDTNKVNHELNLVKNTSKHRKSRFQNMDVPPILKSIYLRIHKSDKKNSNANIVNCKNMIDYNVSNNILQNLEYYFPAQSFFNQTLINQCYL